MALSLCIGNRIGGGGISWSSYWTTNFTGVPVKYSNNPLGKIVDMFRSIVLVSGTYHLFQENEYGSAPNWKIFKRTSSDGLHFTNPSASPLLLPGSAGQFDDLGQADPTVIRVGVGDWRMWFDALCSDGGGIWKSLGYATSVDGETWTKVGAVLNKGGVGTWDSNSVHHPVCILHNGTYYLFYSGSKVGNPNGVVGEIGLATSTDCITWTKAANNPVIPRGSAGQWDDDYVRPSTPIKINNTWYMWYWGYDGTNHAMGLATSSDLINWTKQGVKLQNEGDGPAASCPILFEGTNKKDKIIGMWYHQFPSLQFNFANISLPYGIKTKLSKFTTSALKAFGDQTIGAANVSHSANYIYLHRFTASEAVTPDAIKIYYGYATVKPVDGKVKLALYANGVNTPTTLLAITEEKGWSAVNNFEWNTFNFISPPELNAADYWIAIWSTKQFFKSKAAGGTNNHGNLSLAYGDFPNPITAVTTFGFDDFDMFIIDTRNNVHEIALESEPNNVYFNTINGNKQTSIGAVDSEFDWYWTGGKLYVYSEKNPDIRYQITYD